MSEPASTRIALIRHGETKWSLQRRHTGRTNIPLDEAGRHKAMELRPVVARVPGIEDAVVYVSPLRRARDTAELAGVGSDAIVCDDLLEWDYGIYEGRRTSDIRKKIPGWSVWTDPIIGGETMQQVGARADRMIARAVEQGGLTVMVAHAHILRILGARWCGLPPSGGKILTLHAASLSVLGHEREVRVIEHWDLVPELCTAAAPDQALPS